MNRSVKSPVVISDAGFAGIPNQKTTVTPKRTTQTTIACFTAKAIDTYYIL
jgi:hypothetical protein